MQCAAAHVCMHDRAWELLQGLCPHMSLCHTNVLDTRPRDTCPRSDALLLSVSCLPLFPFGLASSGLSVRLLAIPVRSRTDVFLWHEQVVVAVLLDKFIACVNEDAEEGARNERMERSPHACMSLATVC